MVHPSVEEVDSDDSPSFASPVGAVTGRVEGREISGGARWVLVCAPVAGSLG
jgi:hypothetical protein